jgi:plastocyanin
MQLRGFRMEAARFTLPLTALVLVLSMAAPAGAFHWFRGDENGGPALGCTPTDGALTDASGAGTPGATVLLMHNTFLDLATASPLTVVHPGQSVTWRWASAHCHSATQGLPVGGAAAFDSGFHYPIPAPPTPLLLRGFFDYPVPELGNVGGVVDTGTPTLSFTHTFGAAGTFTYYCVHHFEIGMVGVVVVQ